MSQALKRGYIHWPFGCINKLYGVETKIYNLPFTFIRSVMLQSMHTGSYFVKLILKKEAVDNKLIVSACQASCECAAG